MYDVRLEFGQSEDGNNQLTSDLQRTFPREKEKMIFLCQPPTEQCRGDAGKKGK
jgi:hypothetical protein